LDAASELGKLGIEVNAKPKPRILASMPVEIGMATTTHVAGYQANVVLKNVVLADY